MGLSTRRGPSALVIVITIIAAVMVLMCALGVVVVSRQAVEPGIEWRDTATSSAGADYAQAAPTTQPHQSAPAAPIVTFGDGTYEVGTKAGQIQPGTYVTIVPDSPFPLCMWTRLRGFSGEGKDMITMGSGNEGERMRVTIAPTDAGFESDGCGEWSRA